MTTENQGCAGHPSTRPAVLPYASPPGLGTQTAAELYAQVVWFRRSGFSSALVLVALISWMLMMVLFAFASSHPSRHLMAVPAVLLVIVAGLALLTVCVVVLTGPVYMPKALPDGRLKTWGRANKLIAALFLMIWALICIGMMRAKR